VHGGLLAAKLRGLGRVCCGDPCKRCAGKTMAMNQEVLALTGRGSLGLLGIQRAQSAAAGAVAAYAARAACSGSARGCGLPRGAGAGGGGDALLR